MSREAVVRAVCGDDEECRRGLSEAPRETAEFFSAFSTFTPVLESLEAPLIEHVKNLSSAEALTGDRDLARLAVAHRLAQLYGGKFRGWEGDRCPICGAVPTLFLVKREPGALFEGRAKYAKCVCGFTWRYKWWRCPRCGAEGRENFEVLYREDMQGIFFHKCKRCGHVHVEVNGEIDEVAEYGLRILARYVA